jgi:hypothetical protein
MTKGKNCDPAKPKKILTSFSEGSYDAFLEVFLRGETQEIINQKGGGKAMRRYVSVAGTMVSVFAMVLMMSGCSSDKGPAEQAIKAAETAIEPLKGEAAKIVPDKVKSLQDALSSAKDKFGKKDYKGALADAQAIPGKVKEVLDAATAKKAELTKAWEDLSQGLPKMVEAIKSRVDILSKSKKLPANLPKEKFDEVKSGLETAMKDWTAAQDSAKAGSLADALAKANSIKEKATQYMQTLGMTAPAAAAPEKAPAPAAPAKK